MAQLANKRRPPYEAGGHECYRGRDENRALRFDPHQKGAPPRTFDAEMSALAKALRLRNVLLV